MLYAGNQQAQLFAERCRFNMNHWLGGTHEFKFSSTVRDVIHVAANNLVAENARATTVM